MDKQFKIDDKSKPSVACDSNIIVFYDAQNFSKIDYFDKIILAIQKYGFVSTIRVYHDFIGKDNPWKQLCYKRGMKPCQITSPKKNTADLLITIDALNVACNNNRDIFCFVTNDSDFYPISIELKQRGIKTMLISEIIANKKASFDNEEDYYFTYVERVDFAEPKKVDEKEEIKIPVVVKDAVDETKLKQYISSRYGQLKKDAEGWAAYSTICANISKKYGEIDFRKLSAKDRKDFFIKAGYEFDKLNFRQKKKS